MKNYFLQSAEKKDITSRPSYSSLVLFQYLYKISSVDVRFQHCNNEDILELFKNQGLSPITLMFFNAVQTHNRELIRFLIKFLA